MSLTPISNWLLLTDTSKCMIVAADCRSTPLPRLQKPLFQGQAQLPSRQPFDARGRELRNQLLSCIDLR